MSALKVTVSGSFHRHMEEVQSAVQELTATGCDILSPSDPRVVDAFGEFLFVASDVLRTVKVVQSRHLVAIDESDFLWLVNPDGYVGASAAMEIGFAAARGIPIYTMTPPQDLTMRQFVHAVPSVAAAVAKCRDNGTPEPVGAVLLDPEAAIREGHQKLERIGATLLRTDKVYREHLPQLDDDARDLRRLIRGI